jgi:hypothetical protein
MENVQVEVKDIDITKEETQSVEEVKRQVLSALNDWSIFTMEGK